jgi:hypothetical protein
VYTTFSEANMKKVIEEKDYVTSVRLPKDLYEQVELKSEEMGILVLVKPSAFY